MSDLTWRHLTVDDAPALADLVNHLVEVDGGGHETTPEREAEFLQAPTTAQECQTWGVWDGDDLIAFGVVINPAGTEHSGDARAFIDGGVHADRRGEGIGTALMERLEAEGERRLRAEHPGRARRLRMGTGLQGSATESLARDRGFEPVRYWDRLCLDLADTTPEAPADPAGVTLRCPTEADSEPMRLAHEIAFAGHWGSGTTSPERWHEHWTESTARPAMSTVAVDESGAVLGYAWCSEPSPRELYLGILGTVPEGRGRGLASAILQRTAHLAAASGDYDRIELVVDTANDTSAPRLYERAGYRSIRRTSTWSRPVTGG